MTVRFAIVYEAVADLETATALADRVLLNARDWLDDSVLVHHREWISQSAEGEKFTWTAIKRLAQAIGIRAHGHFDGKPAQPDALAARRAILFLRKTVSNLRAVVLIRDRDRDPARRIGLEQARGEKHPCITVVVGLAIEERESWLISGFDPADDVEASRLETERQKLGFDPRERSHQLTACKDDNAPRSPKRVLQSLTHCEKDRERLCWANTPLDILMRRGAENGLAEYLQEVRDRLAHLIG